MQLWDAAARLALAIAMGALIGMERELYGRFAGFRTYIIVSLGSAVVIMTSFYLSGEGYTLDITRMGAQVITGIGFLGAGVILKSKFNIKGLTTAASLWTTACIGLAAGAGYYIGAAASGIIVWAFLLGAKKFELAFWKKGSPQTVELMIRRHSDQLSQVISLIEGMHIYLEDISIDQLEESDLLAQFKMRIPKKMDNKGFYIKLLSIPGVEIIKYIDENKI